MPGQKYNPLNHVKKSAKRFYKYSKLVKTEDAFWAQRAGYMNQCRIEIRLYGKDYRTQVALEQAKKNLKDFDEKIQVTFAEARRRLKNNKVRRHYKK